MLFKVCLLLPAIDLRASVIIQNGRIGIAVVPDGAAKVAVKATFSCILSQGVNAQCPPWLNHATQTAGLVSFLRDQDPTSQIYSSGIVIANVYKLVSLIYVDYLHQRG